MGSQLHYARGGQQHMLCHCPCHHVTVLAVGHCLPSPLLTWVLKLYFGPTVRGFCALLTVCVSSIPIGKLFF